MHFHSSSHRFFLHTTRSEETRGERLSAAVENGSLAMCFVDLDWDGNCGDLLRRMAGDDFDIGLLRGSISINMGARREMGSGGCIVVMIVMGERRS